jgi:16S rRNA (guanine(966)-N(2))-methyltransferase RsmD
MPRPKHLRIIAGTAGGHSLEVPKKVRIRPTADRIRESLFNIIQALVPGARVLDLFAGTGAFGLEALSRGARQAVFVERRRECARIIDTNLHKTGLHDRGRIALSDASDFPGTAEHTEPFDIVFLDPPYRFSINCASGSSMHGLIARLAEPDILAPGGLIILESSSNAHIPENVGPLILTDSRHYGTTTLSFFEVC